MPATRPTQTRWQAASWMAAVALVALVPFARGFSNTHVFYIRDLSAFFWGRYLWLRHAWLSGSFPLWDPHVGAGQAAYSDALNQIFFLPGVLLRLLPGEALSFNLWVAVASPIAATGAWLFFARRFSPAAAALGAVAFSLCGPVEATANMPNFSYAVALMPWVLWAVDRLLELPGARRMPLVAVAVALQALAGEPVTLFVTAVIALAYAAVVGDESIASNLRDRARQVIVTGTAMVLGLLLAGVQVIPLVLASGAANRSVGVSPDAWSLRPTALLEIVWPHLFGDYFHAQSLSEVPWMMLMFSREPLLFSIYVGVPLLAFAAFGLAGSGARRWRLFWTFTAIVSVVAAFGSYTPIYPVLRDHVPPFGTFRFPVKYILGFAMAIPAGVACAWDSVWRAQDASDPSDGRRERRARIVSLAVCLATAAFAGTAATLAFLLPAQTTAWLQWVGDAFGDASHSSGAWMVQTFRASAPVLLMLSLASAAIMWAIASSRPASQRRTASTVLAAVIAVDLVVRAIGLNPVVDKQILAEPEWVGLTTADPLSRYYVGGRLEGTLNAMDFDASRGFENAPGLQGAASRAALNIQAAFYPSAWGARDLLSYDLPVLWPREFQETVERFQRASREERDRLLDRTGVRYRVLPQRRAVGHAPVMPVPQFMESFLFDWGPGLAKRVSIVEHVRVVADRSEQIEQLFQPGWDSGTEAMVEREPAVAGTAGDPVSPFARITIDGNDELEVAAGVGADGGYLVVLDSYRPDWQATVDGASADLVRANGLFRAVRLRPGSHTIRFIYRPRALVWGAAASVLAACALMVLVMRGRKH